MLENRRTLDVRRRREAQSICVLNLVRGTSLSIQEEGELTTWTFALNIWRGSAMHRVGLRQDRGRVNLELRISVLTCLVPEPLVCIILLIQVSWGVRSSAWLDCPSGKPWTCVLKYVWLGRERMDWVKSESSASARVWAEQSFHYFKAGLRGRP